MSTATLPVERSIQQQYARGPFAFWSDEAEVAWKAESGNKPEAIVIRGKYGFPVSVQVLPNNRPITKRLKPCRWSTWEGALEGGKSYLVGDSWSMADFIRKHRSPLNAWQKEAHAWAVANPYWRLVFSTPGRDWEVYSEGAYVCFALPHQDAGGERHYISRDGKTKVLINVD